MGLGNIVAFQDLAECFFGEFTSPVHSLTSVACDRFEEPLPSLLPKGISIISADL